MACDDTHLPVITARTVAEDSGNASHCSRSRVPDIVGRVDVTEEHETGRDLGDPLAESRASYELHLVVVVVGGIENTIRRTVGDQDVEALRDVVPDPVDGAAILHVGPVTVARGEW